MKWGYLKKRGEVFTPDAAAAAAAGGASGSGELP
jgi:hypothetical protein